MNLYSVTYTLYQRNPDAIESKNEWTALASWKEDVLAGNEKTLAAKVAPIATRKLKEHKEHLGEAKEIRVGVISELMFSEIDLTTATR